MRTGHASLRILHVVGNLWPGGIERVVTDLCLAWRKSPDREPAVCCVGSREGAFLEVLERAGVPVYECRLSTRSLLSFPFRFASLLRGIRPDVVHSHVDFSLPWQVLGMKLAGVKRIVFTQHNEYECWRGPGRLRIIAYYWLTRPFISSYTAVSRKVRDHYAALVLAPPGHFRVIYNPVNTDVFRPAPGLRVKARRAMGVGTEDFVFGTVAALTEQKGHEYLLRAAEGLVKHEPRVRFVFVGDGPLRCRLESLTRELGLEKKVSFLGYRTDVQELYPGFDCFVLPSLWEGFPVVVIEAVASGLPIVATRVGGTPEAIGDGEQGVLVPAQDPGALDAALMSLLGDVDAARRRAAAARQFVEAHFATPLVLERYRDLYDGTP